MTIQSSHFSLPRREHQRSAIFIDADNLAPAHMPQILRASAQAQILCRAFGNAQSATGWLRHACVEFVHTGTGKNASDIAMAVDAMSSAHTLSFETAIICSSDGDFRPLAFALRAIGIDVIGLGETKTPAAFRDACTRWETLEASTATTKHPRTGTLSDENMSLKLRDYIATHSKSGRGVPLSALNQFVMSELRRSDQTVATRWMKHLRSETTRFEIVTSTANAGQSKEKMVRFLRGGFAVQA